MGEEGPSVTAPSGMALFMKETAREHRCQRLWKVTQCVPRCRMCVRLVSNVGATAYDIQGRLLVLPALFV